MNRINPLYIGAFLLILLGFLAFKLGNIKNELEIQKVEYKETMNLATKLNDLKKVYNDKNIQKKSLDQILKNSSFISANIVKTEKKSSVLVSSNSIDLQGLNAFMSKILNATYTIKSLEIKKLSDEKASFDMEITW